MLKEATAFYNQDYNLRESEVGVKRKDVKPREGHFPGNSYPQSHKKRLDGPTSTPKHLALHLVTDQANSENC